MKNLEYRFRDEFEGVGKFLFQEISKGEEAIKEHVDITDEQIKALDGNLRQQISDLYENKDDPMEFVDFINDLKKLALSPDDKNYLADLTIALTNILDKSEEDIAERVGYDKSMNYFKAQFGPNLDGLDRQKVDGATLLLKEMEGALKDMQTLSAEMQRLEQSGADGWEFDYKPVAKLYKEASNKVKELNLQVNKIMGEEFSDNYLQLKNYGAEVLADLKDRNHKNDAAVFNQNEYGPAITKLQILGERKLKFEENYLNELEKDFIREGQKFENAKADFANQLVKLENGEPFSLAGFPEEAQDMFSSVDKSVMKYLQETGKVNMDGNGNYSISLEYSDIIKYKKMLKGEDIDKDSKKRIKEKIKSGKLRESDVKREPSLTQLSSGLKQDFALIEPSYKKSLDARRVASSRSTVDKSRKIHSYSSSRIK